MPLPAVYAKLIVAYRTPQARTMVNVLWYVSSSPVSDGPGTATQLVTAALATLREVYKGVLTTSSQFLGIEVALNLAGVTWNAGSAGGAESGLVTGDEAPNYAAVVVQKRTIIPGRAGRGRLFIGGIPEEFTDNNTLTEDGLVTYQSLAEGLGSNLTTVEGIFNPGHFAESIDSIVPVIAWLPQEILATQRRRRLRPGF